MKARRRLLKFSSLALIVAFSCTFALAQSINQEADRNSYKLVFATGPDNAFFERSHAVIKGDGKADEQPDERGFRSPRIVQVENRERSPRTLECYSMICNAAPACLRFQDKEVEP